MAMAAPPVPHYKLDARGFLWLRYEGGWELGPVAWIGCGKVQFLSYGFRELRRRVR